MSNLIVFPEFEKLKTEIEALRAEMAALLYEKDELTLITCPNIEAAYYAQLGQYEYNIYNLYVRLCELKRRCELIQAYINRQEKPDLRGIARTIETEFKAYKERIETELGKLNFAIAWAESPALSKEDETELKSLYRKIAKILHPDLNPGVTENQIRLFENAAEAYKRGDLETLRFIEAAVADNTLNPDDNNSLQKLKDEKIRLQNNIIILKSEIEDIKSRYPYTLKEIMDSQEKIREREAELIANISEYEGAISYYEIYIEELLETARSYQ